MSDETARNVARAKAVESELHAQADERIRECLGGIARGIPSRLDDLAKRTAQSQPEVTKQLGSSGLKTFREELAAAAQQLAMEVEGAGNEIKWPQAASDHSKADTGKVHSALFDFLYGSRLDKLAAVFKRYGFSVGDSPGHSQAFLLPQYLYQQDAFLPVAELLNSLWQAQRALAVEIAADDEAIVGSLWDGSEAAD
jgi:hypothetical protein